MEQSGKSPRKFKILVFLIVIVAVGGVFSSIYMWRKVKNLENPSLAVESEVRRIVGDISKIVVLPSDETPTLATVSDPEKLRSQPFFANAEVGDKVLIYTVSKKAILWRPSVSKIIEISAINPSSLTTQGSNN
jgi:hypothetical protein